MLLFLTSNGSVIVNHSVALSSSSTATTQQLEKTLKDANGTKNPGGFVFGQITTEGKHQQGNVKLLIILSYPIF